MFETNDTMFALADKLEAVIERIAPIIDTFNRVCYAVGSMLRND